MDFHIKKGDLRPTLRITVRDGNGVAVNLTGATVTFRMKLKGAVGYKVNTAATLVDAANGVVEYVWTGTDTDTAGIYFAEFRIVLAGSQQTSPNDRHLEVQIHDVV